MASGTSTTKTNTAQRMLDTAEGLVQVRGFNGFSYADVADELQITRASLHYHFRGKAELGHALMTRYATRFAEALQGIDRDFPAPPQKLHAYVGLYRRSVPTHLDVVVLDASLTVGGREVLVDGRYAHDT